MDKPFSGRRFGLAVLAFLIVLASGTIGFKLLEDEGWIAAFYRAIVTTTLTGLDTRPRSSGGQVFAIFVLLTGVAIFLYVAGALVEVIARGVLTGAWSERQRRRTIEGMRDHFIICGYGRVGRRIAQELDEAGIEYVVLDYNPAVIAVAREAGVAYIEGSGTEDDDLMRAGLARARGVLAASDSDSDNLYIVLSCRAQRPDLSIVARASDKEAEKKLRLAGADRVVQPYSAAGVEMAKLAIKPQVAAFLDIVSTHGGPDLRFEEIEVTETCPQVGRSLGEVHVKTNTGAVVVALRKHDGTFDTTPDPGVVLEVGDILIAAGTAPELRRLEELFAPKEPVGR